MRIFSFQQLLHLFIFCGSFLRFVDYENLAVDDRLQRIRPFLDQVREICQSKYVPNGNIAADETLLLYKGRLVSYFVVFDRKMQ